MADSEIGTLDPVGALDGSEIWHIVQSGNSRQIDVDTLIAYLGSGLQLTSEKGAANGYAGLDSGGLVPTSQLPTLYTDEMVRDVVGAALVAGSGITITVNDAGDTITITGTGSYTDEMAQDAIGAMLDSTLVYVDGTPVLKRAPITGHITIADGSNAAALGSFTKAQLTTAVSDGDPLYTGDMVGMPFVMTVAVSDESTALTTGTSKVTFRMPHKVTLTDIRASVNTAPTGGTLLTVDVNEAGSTILSTKLTFDASEKTTVTAATPRVISDANLADDAEITIDIDAVGSTIAGAGLKVTFIGTYAA